MTRRSVQLLVDGETLDEVYLVTDKQLRANKNGNLYLQVELRWKEMALTRWLEERNSMACTRSIFLCGH